MITLWIRSQSKFTLMEVKSVKIKRYTDLCYEIYGEGFGGNKEELPLGSYDTKERCLEIIDDIQSYLLMATPERGSAVIYQMPPSNE